ncbi:MAG: hypothetical protein GXP42_06365, partial [Chloroflexi bacterium]|nr:hypothetical protein [Chloroflexota bacterium]
RVHALVLNHPLGAGAAAYRRARRPTVVDSLYLGAYPTSLLREIGGWDESLLATEDFELNARLRCRGGALLVDPAIRSIYLTRESLCEIKRQYARYGAWRAALLRRAREHIRPRHLAPALLPPTLACSLALAIWRPHFLFIPAVYLALAALAGLQLSREAGVHAWPRLFATFLILHLAWGLGFWRALLSRIRQPEIKLV